jgi:hypothetical protein
MDFQSHQGRPDALGQTRAAAAEFSASQLAALTGGLALLANNGAHLWRLQALGDLAAGGSGDKTPRQSDLRSLLNSGALGATADAHEDPFDDVLIEEVAFSGGGSYRIGGGMAEDGVAILRQVLVAVLLSQPKLLPQEPWAELMRTVSAALHLSDWVLRAAGLERNTIPPEGSGVEVPGSAALSKLAELTTFNQGGLQEACQTLDTSCLDPLVRDIGAAYSETELMEGESDRFPLMRSGELTVLSKPMALAAAVRHSVSWSAATPRA